MSKKECKSGAMRKSIVDSGSIGFDGAIREGFAQGG